MTAKIALAEIVSGLDQFIGTQEYHRWSPFFRNCVLTDGTLFLAESAGAFWLMDAIASWQIQKAVRMETFQVWVLKVTGTTACLIGTDGNNNLIARQDIPYTDFPLSEIKLFAGWEDNQFCIYLPSEY